MDHTHRFDGKGELYDKARPCYAAGLLDFLKDELGLAAGCVGADVGSGTGIFTGQLLESGYRVFAVEPNGDMRRKAEEKLSGRRSRRLSIGFRWVGFWRCRPGRWPLREPFDQMKTPERALWLFRVSFWGLTFY